MGSVSDLFNIFLGTINKVISAGSSAANGVWGTITGSLSDIAN